MSAPPARSCPSCGADVSDGQQVCVDCGAPVASLGADLAVSVDPTPAQPELAPGIAGQLDLHQQPSWPLPPHPVTGRPSLPDQESAIPLTAQGQLLEGRRAPVAPGQGAADAVAADRLARASAPVVGQGLRATVIPTFDAPPEEPADLGAEDQRPPRGGARRRALAVVIAVVVCLGAGAVASGLLQSDDGAEGDGRPAPCPAERSTAILLSVWGRAEEVRARVAVRTSCPTAQELSAPDNGLGLVLADEIVVAGLFDLGADPLLIPARGTSDELVVVFGSGSRRGAGLAGAVLPTRDAGVVPRGMGLAYDIVPSGTAADPDAARPQDREPLVATGPADLEGAPRSGG